MGILRNKTQKKGAGAAHRAASWRQNAWAQLAKQLQASAAHAHWAQRNVFLKWQALVAALLFGGVLVCNTCCPAAYIVLQGRYLALFEGADYTPSLVRFTQQAVEAVALQAQAADAPAGASLAKYHTAEAWVMPVANYQISSGYGWREDPFDGSWSFHSGIDFASAEGQVVVAVADGVVERNYLSDSYGNCICIRHADGSVTLYAHLQYAFARLGECVCAGQQIGTVGQTGAATGAHLHFEVIVNNEKQDPSSALGL